MLQQIQDALLPIVQMINAYLSDYILVGLLIAVGPVVFHQDPLCADPLLRRGHAEGFRQPDPFRRPA